jgi:hypothetical protein
MCMPRRTRRELVNRREEDHLEWERHSLVRRLCRELAAWGRLQDEPEPWPDYESGSA